MDEYEGMRKFGREVDKIAGKMREMRASSEVEKMKCGPDGRQSASRERGMTGIERLRGVAGFWRENKLDDIVEQIEREQGGRVSRMRVLSVVTEMERHVSGVEGMGDSPVARWARVLREALGGDGRDHAADVSVSAYDLLPQEDREAVEWVRAHGGLEAVRRRWECLSYYADPVPRSCMEKRLARLQRQIDESHAALGRRREIISELNHRASDLTRENAELRKRAMPEGYEWPTVDGKPVDFVTGYEPSLGVLEAVSIYSNGACEVMGHDGIIKDVKEIHVVTPKALDADGAETRVGDTVYHVKDGSEMTVYGIEGEWLVVSVGGRVRHDVVTHRAPVLAADGLPLREREHVYHVETGAELVVKGLPKPGEYQAVVVFALPTSPASHLTSFDPDQLTHERPDSLDRLAEDIGAMVVAWRSNRDLFDAQEAAAGCVGENTMGAALDSLVCRVKALAGDA